MASTYIMDNDVDLGMLEMDCMILLFIMIYPYMPFTQPPVVNLSATHCQPKVSMLSTKINDMYRAEMIIRRSA